MYIDWIQELQKEKEQKQEQTPTPTQTKSTYIKLYDTLLFFKKLTKNKKGEEIAIFNKVFIGNRFLTVFFKNDNLNKALDNIKTITSTKTNETYKIIEANKIKGFISEDENGHFILNPVYCEFSTIKQYKTISEFWNDFNNLNSEEIKKAPWEPTNKINEKVMTFINDIIKHNEEEFLAIYKRNKLEVINNLLRTGITLNDFKLYTNE